MTWWEWARYLVLAGALVLVEVRVRMAKKTAFVQGRRAGFEEAKGAVTEAVLKVATEEIDAAVAETRAELKRLAGIR